MRYIADVQYKYDPITNKASLYLYSPTIAAMYEEIGFDTRNYESERYELLESLSAYLVRGISIENEHRFERRGTKYTVFTQKCANCNLLIECDGGWGVNISHIRGVLIGKGFSYKIKPLPVAKTEAVLIAYSEGVREYYRALKSHLDLKRKYDKVLDKE